MNQLKKFEIFCGTGGVGKTTLATSRALYHASNGRKVLLITIDPAKRLKDLLKLESPAGQVEEISFETHRLDCLLMNPEMTITRMSKKDSDRKLDENKIIKILARPFGGMNEILSLIELQMQFDKNLYDVIVLDTAPGSHFLDFLESAKKINLFFDDQIIEVFTNLNKSTANKFQFVNRLISAGIKKILFYLEQVTGKDFVHDFSQALYLIYQSKDLFLEGLKIEQKLKNEALTNIFFVTSPEQIKPEEAQDMIQRGKKLSNPHYFAVMNKSLHSELISWEPTTAEALALKNSLIKREGDLNQNLHQNFTKVFTFPETVSESLDENLKQLRNHWSVYGSDLN